MAMPIIITFNGETHTLKEWSAITGINSDTLYSRYVSGMPVELVMSLRTNYTHTIITDEETGISKPIEEWSKELNIPLNTLYYRINVYGWSGHKALQPIQEKNKKYHYDGMELTLKQIEYINGYHHNYVAAKMRRGIPLEDAVKGTAKTPRNAIYFVGENNTVYNEKDWSDAENGNGNK